MTDFYQSSEWRAVRKIPLAKYPHKCMRCGSRKEIQVDHIKARSKHPELALDPDNTQILCRSCNLWKSTSTIDFRPDHKLWRISSHILNYLLAASIWWWLVKTIYINWPVY